MTTLSYELLKSADHALFSVIVRNPHHVLQPLLPPRKKKLFYCLQFMQTNP